MAGRKQRVCRMAYRFENVDQSVAQTLGRQTGKARERGCPRQKENRPSAGKRQNTVRIALNGST